MNTQALASLFRTLLTLLGGILVTDHLATAPDITQATTDLMTILPALMSLISIGGGIYSHWNVKKVPAHAVVIDPAVPASQAEQFHLVGKVIGVFAIFTFIQLAALEFNHVHAAPFCIDALNKFPIGCAPRPTVTQEMKKLEDFLSKPMKDLANFIQGDFVQAKAVSTSVDGLPDGNGNACWTLLISANGIFNTAPSNGPLPGAATILEQLRMLGIVANRVCQNAQCTQVFTEAGNALNTVAPIPNLPNVTDLCSKVPQISQVAIPVSVPTMTGTVAPVTTAK